jgi:hypothetical protein
MDAVPVSDSNQSVGAGDPYSLLRGPVLASQVAPPGFTAALRASANEDHLETVIWSSS